ncbi:hypothetical protein HBI65_244190, partial [Parastagonospora nodorum]
MSRPQIGIDRLPARRVSNEPREAMNCKSCRKRKIKCNRTRPSTHRNNNILFLPNINFFMS